MSSWQKLRSPVFYLLASAMVFCCIGIDSCEHGPFSTSVTPNTGDQGTDVPVTFSGGNFAHLGLGGEPFAVIDGGFNDGVTFVRLGYGDTFMDLRLHIAPTARLGAHTIVVETSAGITLPQTFNVTCAGCPSTPQLLNLVTQPENTPLVPGGPQVTFRFIGTGFTAPNLAVFSDPDITFPPGTPVVQQSGGLDYFDLPITAAANATPGFHYVWVTTAGGTSNVLTLTIDASVPPPVPPPGGPPDLRSITPGYVTKGDEWVSFKCEGSGFGNTPEVIIENPALAPITFYGYHVNQDQLAVAVMIVPRSFADSSVMVRVRNSNTNVTSNGLILTVAEIENQDAPFCYGGFDGVGQGGEADVTLDGRNLDGVTWQSFSGIPGLSFSQVQASSGQVSFHVRADGTPLPPLTGNDATNLIITTENGQSNSFFFPVY